MEGNSYVGVGGVRVVVSRCAFLGGCQCEVYGAKSISNYEEMSGVFVD